MVGASGKRRLRRRARSRSVRQAVPPRARSRQQPKSHRSRRTHVASLPAATASSSKVCSSSANYYDPRPERAGGAISVSVGGDHAQVPRTRPTSASLAGMRDRASRARRSSPQRREETPIGRCMSGSLLPTSARQWRGSRWRRTADAYSFHADGAGLPRMGAAKVDVTIDPSLVWSTRGRRSRAPAFGVGHRGRFDPGGVDRRGRGGRGGYRPGEENHTRCASLARRIAREGGLAITLLIFDESGSIIDADAILNGGPGRRSPSSATIADRGRLRGRPLDLDNVATHEAGHFFGLGEELGDRGATMSPLGAPRDEERSVDMDDEAGIDALYRAR